MRKCNLIYLHLILQWTLGNYTEKTTREACYICQTHKNERNSPNDWILVINSEIQLNTLIALEQFWNVHSNNILRHLFCVDLTKRPWIQEKLFKEIHWVFDEAPRSFCCVGIFKSHSFRSYNNIRQFRKQFAIWIQEHDNQITQLGLSHCLSPWQSLLYTPSSTHDNEALLCLPVFRQLNR